MKTSVEAISKDDTGYRLNTSSGQLLCESLVIASGGLSIPTMGASAFGYEIARQFGLAILPTRAGLVPFTLQPQLKEQLAPLSGVSCPVDAHCGQTHFREPMLVTHRGLSGPSMLQISSYWEPGDSLSVDVLPGQNAREDLYALRKQKPQSTVFQYLMQHLPKRFAQAFNEINEWTGPLQGYKNNDLDAAAESLSRWQIKPSGTEGYRTAEVTLGGVDTRQLSSKTMAVLEQPSLYGHNFQWAWASGVAAGNDA
jgi:predicted Rossmann fold flavoprotein